EAVIQRVSAADAELRQTALGVLRKHPEWADQAIGLIRRWLEKEKLPAEEDLGLRSLILAFQTHKGVQQQVALAVSTPSAPVERRLALLETLAQTGQVQVPSAWREALAKAISHPEAAVRLQAVRSTAILQVPQLDDTLAKLAESKAEATDLRLEALRAIVL